MNGDFVKHDGGKNMVTLVEPRFIAGVGQVLTFGAQKYDRNNWKELDSSELYRYKDALMRHLLVYLDGELIDPESGLSHLHHIGCNTMFLDWFENNTLKEDRNKCITG